MAFCDFCTCEQCQTGESVCTVYHAPTKDGRWICDVCYEYDECVRLKREAKTPGHPCEELNCEHRPALASGWMRKQ